MIVILKPCHIAAYVLDCGKVAVIIIGIFDCFACGRYNACNSALAVTVVIDGLSVGMDNSVIGHFDSAAVCINYLCNISVSVEIIYCSVLLGKLVTCGSIGSSVGIHKGIIIVNKRCGSLVDGFKSGFCTPLSLI